MGVSSSLPVLSQPSFPIVVSGPSGVGKTVLCRELTRANPSTVLSITATTRAPRDGEFDGVDYFFLDSRSFLAMRDSGGLAEWAEVHGHLYGTPREWLEQKLREGRCVVLNIDVQGGLNIRRVYPQSLLVFVLPPSMEELERRLRRRATDSPEQVEARLRRAIEEIQLVSSYDAVVVNGVLAEAVAELDAIVRGERARVHRRLAAVPRPGSGACSPTERGGEG